LTGRRKNHIFSIQTIEAFPQGSSVRVSMPPSSRKI
jgi:hypothetical protein